MKKWVLSILSLTLLLNNGISYSMDSDGGESPLVPVATPVFESLPESQPTSDEDEEPCGPGESESFEVNPLIFQFQNAIWNQAAQILEQDPDFNVLPDCERHQLLTEHFNRMLASSLADALSAVEKGKGKHSKQDRFLETEAMRYSRIEPPLDEKLQTFVLKHKPVKLEEALEVIDNPRRKKSVVILLHGPTRTGKTTLARAIAGSRNRVCHYIKATQVESTLQSSGKLNVNHMVRAAAREIITSGNPSIILIDEIDNLIPQNTHGDDIDTGAIKALAQTIDEFANDPRIVIIGTTNYIDRLPLTNLGRTKFFIEVPRPNNDHRKAIIDFYIEQIKDQCTEAAREDKLFSDLAEKSKGFSIQNIEEIPEKALRIARLRFQKEVMAALNPSWLSSFWRATPEPKVLPADLYEALGQIEKRPDVQRQLEEESASGKTADSLMSASQVIPTVLAIASMGLNIYFEHRHRQDSHSLQEANQAFAKKQQEIALAAAAKQHEENQTLTGQLNDENATRSWKQTITQGGFSLGASIIGGAAIVIAAIIKSRPGQS